MAEIEMDPNDPGRGVPDDGTYYPPPPAEPVGPEEV